MIVNKGGGMLVRLSFDSFKFSKVLFFVKTDRGGVAMSTIYNIQQYTIFSLKQGFLLLN